MRRLWETVRWLRLRQIIGRSRRILISPALPRLPAVIARPAASAWIQTASRRPAFSTKGIPSFLGHAGCLREAADWDRPEEPRLWRYNLHYFDDLNAESAADRTLLHRDLITRWIDENPAPLGTGWEPYPCSLRIVNWIKWASAGNELLPEWQESLAIQTDWLSKNIEWHLLGNHLFANAKALVFAGLYFEGADAECWLNSGLKILRCELREQILPDGGQFERSPMYHSIALEDVLDLINVAERYAGHVEDSDISVLRETAGRMLAWAAVMRHPDREIALFNDSAMRIAPEPEQLDAYARRLDLGAPAEPAGLSHLRDSGYVRAQNKVAVLFADVGEIGPDYLPGHAHADTLSFELSLFGQRCIVDSGCSTYEASEERIQQRGTSAHNTITVDGENSSEVWSSFRVARRARPQNVEVGKISGGFFITASHDGYRRLPGKVLHHRTFELLPDYLCIKDRLEGRFTTADAGLLFHPDVQITVNASGFTISNGAKCAELVIVGGVATLEEASWHPEFGRSLPTLRIKIRLTGQELETRVSWFTRDQA